MSFVGAVNYRLKGIIRHIGQSTKSGHYISYVKHGDQWYKFDDHMVEKKHLML